MTPLVEPTDLELVRKIAAAGGRKYTAGNLDRGKYQRLVVLGWLTEVSVNISDVVYEVTEAGKAAALRDDGDREANCCRAVAAPMRYFREGLPKCRPDAWTHASPAKCPLRVLLTI